MYHILYVGMSTIVSTASLREFKGNRRMQIGAFVNKESGDQFKSCIFTDGANNRCFVAFSSKLGELNPAQIARMVDELQVVTLGSGSHILCKVGANTWEDVDI
jgi:hypothetical protein